MRNGAGGGGGGGTQVLKSGGDEHQILGKIFEGKKEPNKGSNL